MRKPLITALALTGLCGCSTVSGVQAKGEPVEATSARAATEISQCISEKNQGKAARVESSHLGSVYSLSIHTQFNGMSWAVATIDITDSGDARRVAAQVRKVDADRIRAQIASCV